MSLKRNVIANYASQIYITLLGLAVVPVYFRNMGAESYGLVGFFGMLQGWLQLLDMGLSSTLSREVTCYRAGVLSSDRMNALLRALAALFVGAGLLSATVIWLSSRWVANSWLHASTLSPRLLAQCVSLMGMAAALRWIAGLYRGVVNGWEEQVWLGCYNAAIATVRYLGVLAVFIWIGVDPLTFFIFQLLVAIGELAILWWKAGKILPGVRTWPSIKTEPLQEMWRFSGALAFCTIIWVFITQTDKLVLSKTLTLVDYGYFTIAVMVANGINVVSGPISSALLPRLTYLFTQSDHSGFFTLYRSATQWVSIIVWPIAGSVAFFAEPLLFAWTKNTVIAHKAAPVLFWYALGNACLGLAAFQFYMQYAHGKLRLHVFGNAFFVFLLIPSVIWASIYYGAVGAARVWFSVNLMSIFIWAWIVHNRFSPGLHWRWLGRDVLPIALSSLFASWTLSCVATWSNNRYLLVAQLIFYATISLAAAALAAPVILSKVRRFRFGVP
jgi:O-antigen/teichoic acid export membrane protein